MNTTTVFGSGIPTAPDVDSLMKAFGVPEERVLMSYAAIAKVIAQPHRSHRWKSVVTAWKNRLRVEHNVELLADPGKGFFALPPGERVMVSGRRVRNHLRGTRRAGELAVRTEPTRLSSGEMRARDHIIKTVAAIRLAATTAAKELNYKLGKLKEA